jgi:hypothetical protein
MSNIAGSGKKAVEGRRTGAYDDARRFGEP